MPILVLLQANPDSVAVEPDAERDGFFVPVPEIVAVSALHAADWGDRVDAARAEYGRRRRQRGGGSEFLRPENLFYPLCVEDGQPLAEFLERLA